ncbi:MAG: fructose-6-phosphate aldolase [Longimicrobiales bacterium]|jgi:transaldolase|nr:fructose-6-phosphate aldolase [Longimicrobiales bacterium]|tara:strand:+ start:19581 stop:20237 length:657 start_codon:yes stop_codon:yes gene_type:complete
MKIFLDTADIGEIRRAADAGLIDGITTNPSLISKVAGSRDPKEIYLEICEIVDGPISLEVVAIERTQMVEEGRKLAGIHENVVVKVPLTEDGLKTCRELVNSGIPVNVTLCFSVSQALLAAKAGATYISPFVGRIDDISGEGMQLIHQIRQVYDGYGYATEILAASLRHPLHVVESMMLGADCCTIPPKVLWQLAKHPLTDRGLEAFLADWDTLGVEL